MVFGDLCPKYGQTFTNRLSLDFIKIVCLMKNRLVLPGLAEHIKGKENCTILVFTISYFFTTAGLVTPQPPSSLQIFFLSLWKIKIIKFGCTSYPQILFTYLFFFFSDTRDTKHRLK